MTPWKWCLITIECPYRCSHFFSPRSPSPTWRHPRVGCSSKKWWHWWSRLQNDRWLVSRPVAFIRIHWGRGWSVNQEEVLLEFHAPYHSLWSRGKNSEDSKTSCASLQVQLQTRAWEDDQKLDCRSSILHPGPTMIYPLLCTLQNSTGWAHDFHWRGECLKYMI